MRRYLFLTVSLFLLLFTVVDAYSQGRKFYWVGGSGNWSRDVINQWATSSGGSSFHGGKPTANDTVIFDENSGSSGGMTVYVSSNAADQECATMRIESSFDGILHFQATSGLHSEGAIRVHNNLEVKKSDALLCSYINWYFNIGSGTVAKIEKPDNLGFHSFHKEGLGELHVNCELYQNAVSQVSNSASGGMLIFNKRVYKSSSLNKFDLLTSNGTQTYFKKGLSDFHVVSPYVGIKSTYYNGKSGLTAKGANTYIELDSSGSVYALQALDGGKIKVNANAEVKTAFTVLDRGGSLDLYGKISTIKTGLANSSVVYYEDYIRAYSTFCVGTNSRIDIRSGAEYVGYTEISVGTYYNINARNSNSILRLGDNAVVNVEGLLDVFYVDNIKLMPSVDNGSYINDDLSNRGGDNASLIVSGNGKLSVGHGISLIKSSNIFRLLDNAELNFDCNSLGLGSVAYMSNVYSNLLDDYKYGAILRINNLAVANVSFSANSKITLGGEKSEEYPEQGVLILTDADLGVHVSSLPDIDILGRGTNVLYLYGMLGGFGVDVEGSRENTLLVDGGAQATNVSLSHLTFNSANCGDLLTIMGASKTQRRSLQLSSATSLSNLKLANLNFTAAVGNVSVNNADTVSSFNTAGVSLDGTLTPSGVVSRLYWIGGNSNSGGDGNWNNPDNWSTSSGGSPNHCFVPSATTEVVFDNNSFSSGGVHTVSSEASAVESGDFRWRYTNAKQVTFSVKRFNIQGTVDWSDNMFFSSNSYWSAPAIYARTDTQDSIYFRGLSDKLYYLELEGSGTYIFADNQEVHPFTARRSSAFIRQNECFRSSVDSLVVLSDIVFRGNLYFGLSSKGEYKNCGAVFKASFSMPFTESGDYYMYVYGNSSDPSRRGRYTFEGDFILKYTLGRNWWRYLYVYGHTDLHFKGLMNVQQMITRGEDIKINIDSKSSIYNIDFFSYNSSELNFNGTEDVNLGCFSVSNADVYFGERNVNFWDLDQLYADVGYYYTYSNSLYCRAYNNVLFDASKAKINVNMDGKYIHSSNKMDFWLDSSSYFKELSINGDGESPEQQLDFYLVPNVDVLTFAGEARKYNIAYNAKFGKHFGKIDSMSISSPSTFVLYGNQNYQNIKSRVLTDNLENCKYFTIYSESSTYKRSLIVDEPFVFDNVIMSNIKAEVNGGLGMATANGFIPYEGTGSDIEGFSLNASATGSNTLYWIGGTSNGTGSYRIDDRGNWSATSGGGPASNCAITDNLTLIFDRNSFTSGHSTQVLKPLDAAYICSYKNIKVTADALTNVPGQTLEFSKVGQITLSGNLEIRSPRVVSDSTIFVLEENKTLGFEHTIYASGNELNIGFKVNDNTTKNKYRFKDDITIKTATYLHYIDNNNLGTYMSYSRFTSDSVIFEGRTVFNTPSVMWGTSSRLSYNFHNIPASNVLFKKPVYINDVNYVISNYYAQDIVCMDSLIVLGSNTSIYYYFPGGSVTDSVELRVYGYADIEYETFTYTDHQYLRTELYGGGKFERFNCSLGTLILNGDYEIGYVSVGRLEMAANSTLSIGSNFYHYSSLRVDELYLGNRASINLPTFNLVDATNSSYNYNNYEIYLGQGASITFKSIVRKYGTAYGGEPGSSITVNSSFNDQTAGFLNNNVGLSNTDIYVKSLVSNYIPTDVGINIEGSMNKFKNIYFEGFADQYLYLPASSTLDGDLHLGYGTDGTSTDGRNYTVGNEFDESRLISVDSIILYNVPLSLTLSSNATLNARSGLGIYGRTPSACVGMSMRATISDDSQLAKLTLPHGLNWSYSQVAYVNPSSNNANHYDYKLGVNSAYTGNVGITNWQVSSENYVLPTPSLSLMIFEGDSVNVDVRNLAYMDHLTYFEWIKADGITKVYDTTMVFDIYSDPITLKMHYGENCVLTTALEAPIRLDSFDNTRYYYEVNTDGCSFVTNADTFDVTIAPGGTLTMDSSVNIIQNSIDSTWSLNGVKIPYGTTYVVWSGLNIMGNDTVITRDTIYLEVGDTQPPTLTQADTAFTITHGNYLLPLVNSDYSFIDYAVPHDFCGILDSLINSPAQMKDIWGDSIPINVTAFDPHGNSSTATYYVYGCGEFGQSDTLSVHHNGTLQINTAGLIANDTLLAVPSGTDFVEVLTGATGKGVITFAGGIYTYDPLGTYLGMDSFRYVVNYQSCLDTVWSYFDVNNRCVELAQNDHATLIGMAGNSVKIPVLDNDNATGATLSIITAPTKGTAAISNDSIVYTTNGTYTGLDSLQYKIVNGACSSTAWVYILVSEKPDHISPFSCDVVMGSTNFDFEKTMGGYIGIRDGSAPVIGDITGDGKTDIIVPRNNGSDRASKELLVFEASDLNTPIASYTFTLDLTYCGITIADFETTDNKREIVVVLADNYNANSTHYLQVLEVSGTTITVPAAWTTPKVINKTATSQQLSMGGAVPIVTDLNSDGEAEILVYNCIYDRDGTLLNELPTHDLYTIGHHVHNEPVIPAVADIDNDGIKEIALGRTVYKPSADLHSLNEWRTISPTDPKYSNTTIYDAGHTAFLDINGDGSMEVAVITRQGGNGGSKQIVNYIWNVDSGEIMHYQNYGVQYHGGSALTISDIDGDTRPELVFMVGTGNDANNSSGKLYCYEWKTPGDSIGLRWSKTTTDRSQSTTVSAFDFNNDGKKEIVYRDELYLYIMSDTTDGSGNNPGIKVLNDTTKDASQAASATVSEYPVISDIDNDGNAEIITIDSYHRPWTNDRRGRIVIYESATPGSWASARKVWNGFAYNPLYVRKDLSIPRYTSSMFTEFGGYDKYPYNTFLQQVPYVRDIPGGQVVVIPAVDLHPTEVETVGEADSIEFTITIENISKDADFVATDSAITLYCGSVGVSNVLWVDSLPTIAAAIDDATPTVVSYAFKVPIDVLGNCASNNIVIQIADKGKGIGVGVQGDCDETNNSISFAFHVDYGDAPDSYKTLVGSGGAAHLFDANLFFGDTIDVETNAYAVAAGADCNELAGDNANNLQDEDGVVYLQAASRYSTTYASYVDL
ncbi:MAG: Ig-like domain-containing protein, partial [Bacteroidales bacterium]